MIPLRHLLLASVLPLLAACEGESTFATANLSDDSGALEVSVLAPQFVQGPDVKVAPNASTPLVAVLRVVLDQPSTVEVKVLDESGLTVGRFDSNVPKRRHDVTLFRLREKSRYSTRVEVTGVSGLTTSLDGPDFVTERLPADAPPLDVTTLEPALIEPGYRLFCAAGQNPAEGQRGSHICILDEAGELVWYHRTELEVTELRRLQNGNLIFVHLNLGMREIDLLGNVVSDLWAGNVSLEGAPVGATLVNLDSFHHEIFEMPASSPADYLVISTASHTLLDYPLDVVDQSMTADSLVISDVIALITKAGVVLQEWDLLDLLDPRRLCYDSLAGFWTPLYGPESRDWTHANAAIYNEANDEIVISMRHQDAVIAFSPTTSQLAWILGDHDGWNVPWANFLLDPPTDPLAEFEWSYHQHAPVFLDDTELLLFDNGNNRAIPPAAPQAGTPYSRAVQYRIDRTAMTVEQDWAYGSPSDPWYSLAVGDADPMPTTDNVLITDGFRFTGALRWSRVFEVTRSDPAEIAFEVVVRDSMVSADSTNWLIYRAQHLPSFP